ncbi:MAG: LamG-like jellyroll fold domain-containing protein [Acidimicrobiales bacterium]
MMWLQAVIRGVPILSHLTIRKGIVMVALPLLTFLPQCGGGGPGQPGINWVSPNNGPWNGGNQVIVNVNFNGAGWVNWVNFNGRGASINWENSSNGDVDVTVPSNGVAGGACVVVNTAGGNSGSWCGYTYYATQPSVAWVSPNSGPWRGGNQVTVGVNMNGATSVNWVQFNGVNAPINSESGGNIVVTVPAGPPGTWVCITVNTNWNGGTSGCESGYYYDPRGWVTAWGISTNTLVSNPQTFTIAAWFKVAPRSFGGGIISFGDMQTGKSNSYDRTLYVGWNGQLIFGVYNGAVDLTETPSNTIQQNQWYFAAATIGPSGSNLYLDGSLVAHTPYNSAQPYNGYWRIGEWAGPGWPYCAGTGCMSPFGGEISQAMITYRALTPQQVMAIYAAR